MNARDTKKYRIGICGLGFLGNSVNHVFKLHAAILIYDKFKEGFNTFEEMVKGSDFIFICLHTPMYEDNGECDVSLIDQTLNNINNISLLEENRVVIIKSTIPPGFCKDEQKKYSNISIIYMPEFLTARNNLNDAITPSRIIICGEKEPSDKVEELFKYRFGNSVKYYKTGYDEGSLVKYGANCFFALKVSYFNFIYSLCEKLGISYEEIKDMILADGRISNSHASVPGWDLQRGFSNACFPKDINAMIYFSKELDIDPKLLIASWEQNLKDRPSKDWEGLPGVITKRKNKNTKSLPTKN